MNLVLVYYPDPMLRQKAEPVAEITRETRDLIPQMFEIMYKARGIGLAGPQIGVRQRIIVAAMPSGPEEAPVEEVYINPRIVAREGKIREEEGCLSLPGLVTQIDRTETVTAEYTALDGELKRVEVGGLHSRLFQHEIDHLDGILIIDKMSPEELKNWSPLLKELEDDFENKRVRERTSHSEAAL